MLKESTKKFYFFAITLIALFILGGCVGESSTTPMADRRAKTYVDPETGVNYIFYSTGDGGGLSVRYRSDGSIYVSKE